MPHVIKFLFLLISISQISLSQSPLPEAIHKLLHPYYNPVEPGGVIMVAKNGNVIYKRAFGMANLELDVPINDSMIFYIGSNTKQFTAVAILQLVENGKIRLHDTLGKFITCPHPVGSITIQQLLSHVSGLGSNTETPGYRSINRKGVTPIELVNYFTNIPVDFPAGSKWAYNNANYYVLGYLVEKLTGKTYADYITDNIFKPVGMSHSYIGKENLIIKNRPSGYTNFRLGIFNTSFGNVSTLYSSGGIQSTVEDMLKWNQALNSGKLLKPETVQLLYKPQVLTGGKLTSYGMGFHLQELHGSPAWRHGGLVEGFTSETLYLPSEDVYIVMLLNEETFKVPITALSRIIGGQAIGKPYNFDEVAIDEKELKKFVGLYENKAGELVNISEQKGKLTFQRPNGTLYTLYYAGNQEFFFEKDYLRAEFTNDTIGKIKSFRFSTVDIGMTEWVKTARPLLKLSPERIADSTLKQYTGKYIYGNVDTVTISREGVTMYFAIGSQPKQLLAAENNLKFSSLKSEVQLEFVKDHATNKMGLFLIQGDNKRKKYSRL